MWERLGDPKSVRECYRYRFLAIVYLAIKEGWHVRIPRSFDVLLVGGSGDLTKFTTKRVAARLCQI